MILVAVAERKDAEISQLRDEIAQKSQTIELQEQRINKMLADVNSRSPHHIGSENFTLALSNPRSTERRPRMKLPTTTVHHTSPRKTPSPRKTQKFVTPGDVHLLPHFKGIQDTFDSR